MSGASTRPGGQRLGVARFETLLRRLLGVKGEAAPVLAPAVVPVLALNSDRLEWHTLAGENLFQVAGNAPAPGIGNVQYFGLENPAGSGIIATVDYIAVKNKDVSAAFVLQMFPMTTIGVGTGQFNGLKRDERGRVPASCYLTWWDRAVIGGFDFLDIREIAAGGVAEFPAAFVVPAGFALVVRPIPTDFGTHYVIFRWTERTIERSEVGSI